MVQHAPIESTKCPMDNTISTETFPTSLGWISIAANDHGIIRASLPEPTLEDALKILDHIPTSASFSSRYGTQYKLTLLTQAKELLTRYCNGEDVGLDDIPIDDTDWTPYTQRARAACRTIPRGQTRTYAWLAQQASGKPNSARAAGRAMATNPDTHHHPLPPRHCYQRKTTRLRRHHRFTPKTTPYCKWKALSSPLTLREGGGDSSLRFGMTSGARNDIRVPRHSCEGRKSTGAWGDARPLRLRKGARTSEAM